ncbi:MAG: hypothetical protein RBS39_11170 [Phycisphaerales bacterium]|jgi:hypothetical protein|nr:hypothetical protein [Phycisphaerales bacterium]
MRTMSNIRRGLAGVVLAPAVATPLVLFSSAGLAQESRTLFVIEHTGLANVLSDPRDAGLARAFSMLPARLGELPGEIDDMEPEVVPMLDLALRTVAQPMRMAITYNAGDQSGGGFGYGMLVSVRTQDEAHANRLDGLVRGAILEGGRLQPRASTRSPGMMDLPIPPVGIVTIGPRMADDGPRFEAWLGSVPGADAGVADLPAPAKGVKVFARGAMDFRALNPAVDLARGFMGSNFAMAEPGLEALRAQGLVGEDAIRVAFQMGTTEREAVTMTEVLGAKKFAAGMGLPSGALARESLRAIPVDATFAAIKRVGVGDVLSGMLDSMGQYSQGRFDPEVIVTRFRDETGVDLRTDVFDALGDVQAFYMSDTTGGGSLMSATLLLSVDDRAKIENALVRLSALATQVFRNEEPEAGRYIKLHAWEHEGHRLISLRADGLPLPIELTVGISNGWLVISPSAQGAIAALRQAQTGGKDITAIGAVKESIDAHGGAASLTYMDTARLARGGYAFTQALGTALGSAVRSPSGGRDPGLVVPGYHELLDGARPSVQVSYWRGDDYVSEGRGDRSMLVNVSAMGGLVKEFLPLVAIPAMAAAGKGRGFSDAGGAIGPVLADVREWLMPATPAERFALAMAVSGGLVPTWDVEGDLHDAWSAVMLAE